MGLSHFEVAQLMRDTQIRSGQRQLPVLQESINRRRTRDEAIAVVLVLEACVNPGLELQVKQKYHIQ